MARSAVLRHVAVTNSIFHVRHTVTALAERTAAIRTLTDRLLRLEMRDGGYSGRGF